MHSIAKSIYSRHKNFWSKTHLLTLGEGGLLFVLALFIQHFAYNYIDNRVVGTAVQDLLLDNLAVLNLDIFIVQGALLLTFILIGLLVAKPQYVVFSIKALALFLIVRSFFISLTHLGANLHQITLDVDGTGFWLYDFLYNAKNDFFFSGHVGSSFLLGLIFWKESFWRNFFFVCSAILGMSMILAHMHYSIDVFAAPFITYGIFVIATKLFRKDFQLI